MQRALGAEGARGGAFRYVRAASESFADAEQRRRYDETLGRVEDRFSPLSWSFVRSPAAGDLRRPVRPGSLSGEVLLTPKGAAAGGVLPLGGPLLTIRPSCSGTGRLVSD